MIACIDARFDLVTRKFLKRAGIATYDLVKIPGAAKPLASPDSDAVRDFVLGMVRISQSLHGAPRVLLIGHNDCGAYGGAPPDTDRCGPLSRRPGSARRRAFPGRRMLLRRLRWNLPVRSGARRYNSSMTNPYAKFLDGRDPRQAIAATATRLAGS